MSRERRRFFIVSRCIVFECWEHLWRAKVQTKWPPRRCPGRSIKKSDVTLLTWLWDTANLSPSAGPRRAPNGEYWV